MRTLIVILVTMVLCVEMVKQTPAVEDTDDEAEDDDDVSMLSSDDLVQNDKKKSRRQNRKRHRGKIVKTKCDAMTTNKLRKLLGPAFNARYMAIDSPPDEQKTFGKIGVVQKAGQNDTSVASNDQPIDIKKKAVLGSFKVAPDYKRDLPDHFPYPGYIRSSYLLNSASTTPTPAQRFLRRIKRGPKGPRKSLRVRPSTKGKKSYPWQCKSKIMWQDLGDDHFPRFLRTVSCTSDECWFGHFRCIPRAFTINVLRRKTDKCVPVYQKQNGKITKKILRYEHQWIFEERSVTFCCDCASEF